MRLSDERQLWSRLCLALIAGLLTSWCVILGWERRCRSGERNSSAASPVAANIAALLLSSAVTLTTFFLLEGLDFVPVSRHTAFCLGRE